ncbi:hypothetical protein GDO81_024041 [Engystomops pustulosus]|uniref:Uncharacterized protein n=1 Tax=Engystomops pustulosus TaxID=76066 RepID=A0AAV6YRW0_ENGPU|nr:hypothetical protein GDO81_024041 [Engystomops pustulosus]
MLGSAPKGLTSLAAGRGEGVCSTFISITFKFNVVLVYIFSSTFYNVLFFFNYLQTNKSCPTCRIDIKKRQLGQMFFLAPS